MSETDLYQQALRERFGLSEFRGSQREAIDAVAAGRDVLLTMPTGAGKSLVYQLPALVLDGMTLVVSPLIALMKDQVDALVARGIAATFVNSSIDGAKRRVRLEAAARGEIDLLFVTPERFRSPVFREMMPRLHITRLAIDEAHCISQWGHDFRPDYSRLGLYREQLGDPPTLALTATATPQVAQDIHTALRLQDPLVIRTGIERENLFLGVSHVFNAEEKTERLAERVRSLQGAGIVYSTLIKDLEALHSELARRGISSLVYHGGLSAEERRQMQDRFMASDSEVVLATNAFGMGVDKADIRFVLHAQLPRTLEAWSQEVGRAGRDGQPAWCELFYFEQDLAIQQNFIQWANPTLEYLVGVYEVLRGWGERIQIKDLDDLRQELLIKERRDNRVSISLKWLEVFGITAGSFDTRDLRVVEELNPGDLPKFVGTGEKLKGDLTGLLTMVQFAKQSERCRRQLLAEHFELDGPTEACGACDVCTSAVEWLQAEFSGGRQEASPQANQSSEMNAEAEAAREAVYQRGDWVRVDKRHIGQVVRVEGSGRRVRLMVESATDLRRRRVDPRRQRVEKLDRG
ncbi:MAG: ATP-dependent DNA helicase RecQ [Planctomycetota bacterium]|jgi:ATP-dependent DNA helicase RecQ